MHTILYYLIIGLLDSVRIFIIYKYLLQLKLKSNRNTVLFLLGLAVSVYFVLYYFNLDRAYKAARFYLFLYVPSLCLIAGESAVCWQHPS